MAPEKTQLHEPFKYLGHTLLSSSSTPLLPQISIPNSLTLVQLQQLLGNINWARPYLGLTTAELMPLFAALKGHTHPSDIISMSTAMKQALEVVNAKLLLKSVDRVPAQSATTLSAAILPTPALPTAIIFAKKDAKEIFIIEWLHLPNTPPRNIYTMVAASADLI